MERTWASRNLAPAVRAALELGVYGATSVDLHDAPSPPIWEPTPGSPQERAMASAADVVGFGGQAGGGKSDVLLGKAITRHRRSIIFRRLYPLLRDLIARSREIIGPRGRFAGGSVNAWRFPAEPGRSIEFAACQYEDDKTNFQGRPHDFIGIDEATEFTESQVRFFMGWLRTIDVSQPCQCLLTFNPPTTKDGEWVIRYFAPWIDKKHHNPAADGELRWFLHLDGEDKEVAGPHVTAEVNGEEIRPQSRTFFRARLADNPYLARTDYGRTLAALPEPLRSQLLFGDFEAGLSVDPWQVIPTAWVQAAMDRWSEEAGRVAQDCVGLDVARGGKDRTVATPRHGYWFGKQVVREGARTPDGASAAAVAMEALEPGAYANVDAIAVGGAACDALASTPPRGYGVVVYPVNVAEPSEYRDRSRRFKCRNLRAEMAWRMRDALDPEGPQAGLVMLPPDRELLQELTEAKYEITAQGIKVEDKDDIAGRLKRSPDKADSACLTLLPPRSRPSVAAFGGVRPTIQVR